MVVRHYQESDRAWAEAFMHENFGGPLQARRGQLIDVLALPGFVAEQNGQPLGLVTYRRENAECELAFIAALEPHEGIGTALLKALLDAVPDFERIWLVTTNDNLERSASISGAASCCRHFGPEPSTSHADGSSPESRPSAPSASRCETNSSSSYARAPHAWPAW
jgi:hypothetical protein